MSVRGEEVQTEAISQEELTTWKSEEVCAIDTFQPDRVATPTFPQRDSNMKEITRNDKKIAVCAGLFSRKDWETTNYKKERK